MRRVLLVVPALGFLAVNPARADDPRADRGVQPSPRAAAASISKDRLRILAGFEAIAGGTTARIAPVKYPAAARLPALRNMQYSSGSQQPAPLGMSTAPPPVGSQPAPSPVVVSPYASWGYVGSNVCAGRWSGAYGYCSFRCYDRSDCGLFDRLWGRCRDCCYRPGCRHDGCAAAACCVSVGVTMPRDASPAAGQSPPVPATKAAPPAPKAPMAPEQQKLPAPPEPPPAADDEVKPMPEA